MKVQISPKSDPKSITVKDGVAEVVVKKNGTTQLIYEAGGLPLTLQTHLLDVKIIEDEKPKGYKADIQKQLEARIAGRNFPNVDAVKFYQIINQATHLEYHAIIRQTSTDFGTTFVSIKHFVHCDAGYGSDQVPELESLEYSSYTVRPDEFEVLTSR